MLHQSSKFVERAMQTSGSNRWKRIFYRQSFWAAITRFYSGYLGTSTAFPPNASLGQIALMECLLILFGRPFLVHGFRRLCRPLIWFHQAGLFWDLRHHRFLVLLRVQKSGMVAAHRYDNHPL